MPAVVDDPASPTIYRVSGAPPFPDPAADTATETTTPAHHLPADIVPRKVTLRDRQTVATILPIGSSRHQVPPSLISYLCDQINREIDGGDTYPMMETFTPSGFAAYWFQNFGAVMLLGDFESAHDIPDSHDWARDCLGSFYIKPNYPGRSSHVCNGGLLVTDASRNRGVGRLMGESYIDWAPRLGYTYSVFNLVYETNVASCKIWDALGFKRIGRVKGCGNLKSHPDRLVDAIIYGRDLPPPRTSGDGSGGSGNGNGGEDGNGNGGDAMSEERFDKIRYYLKYGRYPNGADRAEKSRLRSAATHYKLLEDGDTLMLKDKLVVSDPGRQYEIARNTHALHHGGINKTTATIAEKYHWSRIKETVSDVIRLCSQCKELGKAPTTATTATTTGANNGSGGSGSGGGGTPMSLQMPGSKIKLTTTTATVPTVAGVKRSRSPTPENGHDSSRPLSPRSAPPDGISARHTPPVVADADILSSSGGVGAGSGHHHHHHHRVLGLRSHHDTPLFSSALAATSSSSSTTTNGLDPVGDGSQVLAGPYANPSDISVVRPLQTLHSGGVTTATLLHDHHNHPHHHHHHLSHSHGGSEEHHDGGHGHQVPPDVYQPIDPQIMNHHDDHHHSSHVDDEMHTFESYHNAHSDFQALLHATEDDDGVGAGVGVGVGGDGVVGQDETDRAAVDRDLEMLISHGDDDVVDGEQHSLGGLAKAADKTGGAAEEEDVGGDDVVPGQADADMDDLADSVLRDGQEWT